MREGNVYIYANVYTNVRTSYDIIILTDDIIHTIPIYKI